MIKNMKNETLLVLDLFSLNAAHVGMQPSLWYRKADTSNTTGSSYTYSRISVEMWDCTDAWISCCTTSANKNNPLAWNILKASDLPMEALKIIRCLNWWLNATGALKRLVRGNGWKVSTARYGTKDNAIEQAWTILANGILQLSSRETINKAYYEIFLRTSVVKIIFRYQAGQRWELLRSHLNRRGCRPDGAGGR